MLPNLNLTESLIVYFVFAICILFIVLLGYFGIKKDKAKTFERDNVIKTRFLDQNVTSSVTSSKTRGDSIGRAIVGGVVAGPAGTIIGAGTGKKKTTYTTAQHSSTTFLVYYKDGSQSIKTVDEGSDMYKLYLNKLSVDEQSER